LGCAHTILPGWVNVDFFGRVPSDVSLDVTSPLPVVDASIDAIFTEHMVEHLTYEHVLGLMRECARALRVGGVLRIVVPDFELYMHSYTSHDDFIRSQHPELPTPLLALASIAYGFSHRSIWDADTLVALLTRVGLTAEKSRFGQSRIVPCPDTSARQPGSLYVEAVKTRSHHPVINRQQQHRRILGAW
jgi:hypothetical protein